ncbi:hypothetical protein Scep_004060 [Stephania cephalantha]|uniref:Uncharacterized protein n=1 Tax=Stephania cephalantha TaxID=152367 RepID=A0AAP0KRT7_9MAGN
MFNTSTANKGLHHFAEVCSSGGLPHPPRQRSKRSHLQVSSRKGKEIVVVDNPIDLMGFRTNEVVLALQKYPFNKSMAKSIVDNELHVEQIDRNHVLDKSNLIMMGLVFDEITRRWAQKVPNKDLVGEGGGNNQGKSDEDDDMWGGGEPIPILDNDIEPEIESLNDTMECRLARVEDCLLSLNGTVGQRRRGGWQKDFINKLDPVEEECNWALNNRRVRKEWKSKYRPDKGSSNN